MLLLKKIIAQRLRVGSHIEAPLSHPGFKSAGDRLLIALLFVHGFLIAYVFYYFFADSLKDGGYDLWYEIGISESINFFVWFLKMLPLFVALYPIDRVLPFPL